MIKRRKGVAIIENKKGILVVAGRSKEFMLPGGGAEKWESRKKATIREIYEETNLKTKDINYLFNYIGKEWHDHKGRLRRNDTKVFLVHTEGIHKPKNEIKYISFWKKDSKLKLTSGTKKIIKKYFN